MVDEDAAGQRAGKVENETKGGRYGTAPEGKPHLSPEIEPARGAMPDDIDVDASTPGMLPENAGESPDNKVYGKKQNDVSGENADTPHLEGEKHYARRDDGTRG